MSRFTTPRANRRLARLVALLLTLTLVSCGGPTQPSGPRLELQPGSLTLKVGESATVAATLGGVATTAVSWSSDKPSVATVEAGMVTALSVGSTVVRAQSTQDTGKSSQLNVTVTAGAQTGQPGAVVKTAGGSVHSTALLADGSVVSWGANLLGQLGVGILSGSSSVEPLEVSITDVVDIASGDAFTLALRDDGTVWGWGSNLFGQLGSDVTAGVQYTPVQIAGVSGAASVAAGANTAFAVLNDGTVVGWGANINGSLGRGDYTPVSDATPAAVKDLEDVTAISVGGTSGSTHVLALRSDGTVWAWGGNMSGELGATPATPSRPSAAAVPGVSQVVQVAAGGAFSLALRSDDSMLAWGAANVGQLGAGDVGAFSPAPLAATLSEVDYIAAGQLHGLAVHADGTVSSWGANTFGQLGIGTEGGLRFDPVEVSGLSGVVSLSAGVQHSLAIDGDGQVWAWGNNLNLQSGAEADTDTTFPTLLW